MRHRQGSRRRIGGRIRAVADGADNLQADEVAALRGRCGGLEGHRAAGSDKERELAGFFNGLSDTQTVIPIKEVLDFEIHFTREKNPKIIYINYGTLKPLGGRTFTRGDDIIRCREKSRSEDLAAF